jgi:hypothetical protein
MDVDRHPTVAGDGQAIDIDATPILDATVADERIQGV